MIALVRNYLRELFAVAIDGWNRFWFTPADPASLGLVRILTGLMLFYTHLVWTLDFDAFLGEHPWISKEAVALWEAPTYAWSFWNYITAPAARWGLHLAGL